jgi:glycopeptide antibiotics resistance protein
VIALAAITLVPLPRPGDGPASNIVPLQVITGYLTGSGGPTEVILQIVGNIVLFVPLGWILSDRCRSHLRPGHVWIVAAGGLIAVAIELLQGFIIDGRAGDVDDVLLNTIGVGLGAYLQVTRARRRPVPR